VVRGRGDFDKRKPAVTDPYALRRNGWTRVVSS